MTDFSDADTLSTTIDTESGPAAGGGGVVLDPVDTSPRGDLEAVFKEEADKAPEKVEPAKEDADKSAKEEGDKPATAKPEKAAEDKPAKPRAEDGKFAARERTEGDKPAETDKPSGDKRFVEAPANFLPKAKEVWRNTPNAVQAEVARMAAEHTEATERTRATTERYESIRQYDDLARSNGRELKDSLAKMTEIERDLQTNPVAGLNKILMEVGPRKADGQPFSLYEVAQFIAQQQPDTYQRMVAPPAQPQREDPRVAQLQQQMRQMHEQHANDSIITPFKAQNPRFDELSNDIAMFLQSGRIPQSLSPQDRLAAAYDMAERINPPSHANDAGDRKGPADSRGADEGFSRSIKSSPGSVSETYEPEAKAGESVADSLRKEMRRLTR